MPDEFTDYLRLEGISKRFLNVNALDNVSLSLKKQTIHALVGHNGAGKSTLINILMGAIPKDNGKIFFDGVEVQISSPSDAMKFGLACIHQEMFVIPDLSVAENIFIGDLYVKGPLRKVDYKRMYSSAKDIFTKMGVDLDVKRNVRGLGVAQQQLIMIARALHRKSSILLMDEPTSSLDSHEIDNLFSIVRNLCVSGVSIIYISHYLDEIFEIADEVSVLRNGKNVINGSINNFNEEKIIEHMLGYKVETHPFSRNQNYRDVVLEVKNLTCLPRLKDISFKIRAGEIIGFAGLLGSGRTELVRAIFGVDNFEQGEIVLNGKKLTISSPHVAVNSGIGLLTEERSQGIIPQFSIKHNITLPNLKDFSNIFRIDFKKEDQITKTYIQKLNIIATSVGQKIKTLSGGNQQKVIISKWLQCGTKLLLLDEPTKGVDVGAKSEILKLIHQLASDGLAVILISSEFDDLIKTCNRILILKRGRITKEITDISSDSALQAELNA